MLNELKKSLEIVFHLPSGKGYYAVDHKIIPFNLTELDGDVEICQYILENGTPVDYEHRIDWKTDGKVYKYTIYNNGSYEFAESRSLYSLLYLSEDEFNKMCEKAQESIKRNGEREKDVSNIKYELLKLYPEIFIQIADGQGFNSYEWED